MNHQEPPQDQRDAIAEWAHGLRAAGAAWHEIQAKLEDTGRTDEERAYLARHSHRLEGWHQAWYRRDRAQAKATEQRETGIEGEWLEDAGTGAGAGDAPMLRRAAPEDLEAVLRYLFRDLVLEAPVWTFHGYHTLQPGEEWEQVKGAGCLGRVEWRAAAVIVRGGTLGTKIYPECRIRGLRKPGWNGTLSVTLHMDRLTLGNERMRKLDRALTDARKKLEANPREGWKRRTALAAVARLEARLEEKKKACEAAFDAEKIMSRLATLAVHYRLKDTGIKNNTEAARATNRTKQAVSAQRKTLKKEYSGNTGGRAGFEGQRARDDRATLIPPTTSP